MGIRDPRIDAYIARSAEFARPILERLREVVHEACPDVVETVKWNSPSFEYRGLLCGFAAFKRHCLLGFWKHSLVVGGDDAFGRFEKLSDLPSKTVLKRYVKEAMRLNEQGVKAPREKTAARKPVPKMHPDLKRALGRNRKAAAAFERFSPSHKREYLEWIAEAKRDDTRARRVAQAVEWMAEGKPRNWKYVKR